MVNLSACVFMEFAEDLADFKTAMIHCHLFSKPAILICCHVKGDGSCAKVPHMLGAHFVFRHSMR